MTEPEKPDQEQKPKQEKPAARRTGGRVPPLRVYVVMTACLLLAAALQLYDSADRDAPSGILGSLLFFLDDHAEVNVVKLVLVFIAMMAPLFWFTVRSGYSFRTRMIPWCSALVLLVIAFATLQIHQVSGELIPTFKFRWAPDPDEQLDQLSGELVEVDLGKQSERDFPQFLGPSRNLVVKNVQLDRDWKQNPPKRLWRQPIGAGWSGFVAVNGFAVTMEQRGEKELVTCYEIQTGKARWWHALEARHQTILGGTGPRATPTIDEGRVYAQGATGMLRVLDGATGKLIWQKDLLAEFGIKSPADDLARIAWGRSGSPLIVDNLVIVPAGGAKKNQYVSLVAYEKTTGKEVWRGGDTQISYSSPNIATLTGTRQILIINEDNATGHDLKTGETLWSFDWAGNSNADATASQAVPVPPDRVLLSKGYGIGAALIQLEKGVAEPKELWHQKSVLKTKFTNVALKNGYIYGLSDGILECVDLETGKRQWKRGRYGHGQILLVEDLLLILSERGELILVEAAPQRHRELGRAEALEGKTWNTLCLYGRYLLVRNGQQAACFELAIQ